MNLTKITPIESNNQRVLTTAQIAEAYGTTAKRITDNFNRNVDRYQKGVHFHVLKGALLQDFISKTQIGVYSKNTPQLYLWTEKGALLHAKSLNTNKAWDVYIYLVDFYFRVKSALVEQLQAQVAHLLRSATIAVGEQERLRIAARANIHALFGGKNTVSYKLYALRVYKSLWREYRKHFRLDSYRNTPEYRFNEGLDFIRAWEPGKWQRNAIKSIEKDFMNFLETFFDDKDKDGYRRLLADYPAIVEEYINAIR
jgi:phage regulator Rha-like protein